MLKKLIGAQVLSIGEDTITVKLNDEIHTLEILTDNGGCCGYAEFETKLMYSENNERNPIITNVEIKHEDNYYNDFSVVTFYGESKEIAKIESEAGSGSGWSYGACVNIYCKTLDINEILASW